MNAVQRIARLIACAAPILVSACVRQPTRDPRADATSVKTREAAPSLYDLTARWHDQHGAERSLSSFRGRAVAIAAIYTRCSATCPLTVIEMKRIEAATDSTVALVVVSLDPASDTPRRLARYAQDHDLASSRWTLLNGTDDGVRDLAVSLGVRYRKLSRDEIAHSNLVTLLDANGSIVSQQAGVAGADSLIALAHTLGRK